MLPNGDFEKDRNLDVTKLIGWAKLKENACVFFSCRSPTAALFF
jgi:hypothetical protein